MLRHDNFPHNAHSTLSLCLRTWVQPKRFPLGPPTFLLQGEGCFSRKRGMTQCCLCESDIPLLTISGGWECRKMATAAPLVSFFLLLGLAVCSHSFEVEDTMRRMPIVEIFGPCWH